jgi:hypothetical protein
MIDKAYLKYLTFEYRKFQTQVNAKALEAVRLGTIIKPTTCSACPTMSGLEMHHPDYAKPLEVLWVCKKCHADAHLKAPIVVIQTEIARLGIKVESYNAWLITKKVRKTRIVTISPEYAKTLNLLINPVFNTRSV